MSQARVLAVIPARIGSQRLPRKPLHRIAGRPLIEWVWRRVNGFGLDAVVVATDSDEIAEVCSGFGARVEMTSPDLGSGTERTADVARREAWRDHDVVVNVQGDEPFIAREHVVAAAGLAAGEWDVGTVATPIRSLEAWRDPAVVKVVCGRDGGALYFSRAPIPHARDAEPGAEQLGAAPFLRHLGVYAFRREALQRWVALPPHPLERIEVLEQLRPLAAGMRFGVAVVEHGEGGVDTLEDAKRAERRLLELESST